MNVLIDHSPPVFSITLNRPERRNAVDRTTAEMLADGFRAFDADEALSVAVLQGAGGNFCAGADLKAFSEGQGNRVEPDGDGPMGPTRMRLSKPVIAAVSGYAVAGGLELALWCDLRIAEKSAIFGVFCRRFGVPLIDGGTVRLAQIVGVGRALDLILTGRPVSAEEAYRMGLVTEVVPDGESASRAHSLAREIASHPQTCLRNDRASLLSAFDPEGPLGEELRLGLETLASGEALHGAKRFSDGAGRHGGRTEKEPT
ncbi:MAG: crotonase/enoyl-CoA hydratase family protein [Myxococcota bacterium]